MVNRHCNKFFVAQWLSGRVLVSRSRGCGFDRHCVVSLSKSHLSLLSTGTTQEDLSRHEKLLTGM